MAVTKTITTVPVGIVAANIYQSPTMLGIYALSEQVAVTPGDVEITFEVVDDYWYKFTLVNASGEESAFSSPWQNAIDTRMCQVYGTCLSPDGLPVAGVTVRALLTPTNVLDATGEAVEGTVTATSDVSGQWALSLLRNSVLQSADARYTLTMSGQGFSKTKTVLIPDQASIEYTDLVFGGSMADLTLSIIRADDSKKWILGETKRLTFDVTEEDELIDTLTGCTAQVRVVAEDMTTPVVPWTTATVDGMTIRYVWTPSAAGTYFTQAKLTDSQGVETIMSVLSKGRMTVS